MLFFTKNKPCFFYTNRSFKIKPLSGKKLINLRVTQMKDSHIPIRNLVENEEFLCIATDRQQAMFFKKEQTCN